MPPAHNSAAIDPALYLRAIIVMSGTQVPGTEMATLSGTERAVYSRCLKTSVAFHKSGLRCRRSSMLTHACSNCTYTNTHACRRFCDSCTPDDRASGLFRRMHMIIMQAYSSNRYMFILNLCMYPCVVCANACTLLRCARTRVPMRGLPVHCACLSCLHAHPAHTHALRACMHAQPARRPSSSSNVRAHPAHTKAHSACMDACPMPMHVRCPDEVTF